MIYILVIPIIYLYLGYRWARLKHMQILEDYVLGIPIDYESVKVAYDCLSEKDRNKVFERAIASGMSKEKALTLKEILCY